MRGIFIAKNNSFSNNIKLLKSRREPFNKNRLEGMPNKYHRAIRIKRATKVQLEKIRRNIRMERKDTNIRIALAIVTAIGICLAVLFIAIHLAENYINK